MRTVIRAGRVFDVVSGEFQSAEVLLEDGLIREVCPELDGDEEFDATGLSVLPGWYLCHGARA